MFRMRRYRIALLVAVILTVAIYHYTQYGNWAVPNFEELRNLGYRPPPKDDVHADAIFEAPLLTSVPPNERPATTLLFEDRPPIPHHATASPITKSLTSTTSSKPSSQTNTAENVGKEQKIEEEFGQFGEGRYEAKPLPAGQQRPMWIAQQEHFPVVDEELISLPIGFVEQLPKIQYSFSPETSTQKSERRQKQSLIKQSFMHAWSGYKTFGMPHDEIKPLSNKTADPFNGWGATLVDTLDTLWIMGLEDEFAEAVEMVEKIDFKTSDRKDIPLFETTIRYLGGLVAAYDLSHGKYPALLDKAVELANILMGAFDTPNRMPIPYYNWAPAYTSQPHRSSPRTVMAEIGSLCMEFTRLAQITKENRYYDAVARVTNALEEWQMKTDIPGLWPVRLDSSGCKKPDRVTLQDSYKDQDTLFAEGKKVENMKPKPGRDPNPDDVTAVEKEPERISKRQVRDGKVDLINPASKPKVVMPEGGSTVIVGTGSEEVPADVECDAQGLNTEPHANSIMYAIGAMADSTYEYFPKEYALLGGLNSQYKTMYLNALEAMRDRILYRPMTKQNKDILFPAKVEIFPKEKDAAKKQKVIYEGAHLSCFAGGMFALGSKMFNIPSDMELAEKLTNGCIWAYESTTTGIMPEEFELTPCKSRTSCMWDEARWHEFLDPDQDERIAEIKRYNSQHQSSVEKSSPNRLAKSPSKPVQTDPPTNFDPSSKKRDLDAMYDDTLESTKTSGYADEQNDPSPSKPELFVPKKVLSHEDFVAAKIAEERLMPGYTRIHSREYKLRPEAIESVFIMYRITGDEYWREKGWDMFTAIESATKTKVANAALKDVTSLLGEQRDTMESFWLAETLKYFYLLFSEPDLISLDDYVLNTEAHPFRRPT